jgi:hypothetical protein
LHYEREESPKEELKSEQNEVKVQKKVVQTIVRESEEEHSDEQEAFELEEEMAKIKGKKPLLKVKTAKTVAKKPKQPRATSKAAAANKETKADECAFKSEIKVTKMVEEEQLAATSTATQLVEEIPVMPASNQTKVKSLGRKNSKSKLEEKVEMVEPAMSVAIIEESCEETKGRRKKKVDYKETQLNA